MSNTVGWRISSWIRWDQVNIRVPANNVSCLIRLEILEPTPRYIVIRRISEIDLLSSNSTGDPWNFDTSTYLLGDSLCLASSFSSHSTNRDISEMALSITKIKNGDHFYRPNYPPKCGKTHLRKWFFGQCYLQNADLGEILKLLHIPNRLSAALGGTLVWAF